MDISSEAMIIGLLRNYLDTIKLLCLPTQLCKLVSPILSLCVLKKTLSRIAFNFLASPGFLRLRSFIVFFTSRVCQQKEWSRKLHMLKVFQNDCNTKSNAIHLLLSHICKLITTPKSQIIPFHLICHFQCIMVGPSERGIRRLEEL
jgi:hypothetical protein